MSGPNPDAKLRVLVLDARLSDSQEVRMAYGEYPSGSYSAVEALQKTLGDRIEITRVDDFASVMREVRSHPVPYYSLVVYSAYHIRNQMGGMKIQGVKDTDPFMPQMIYGEEITYENFAKGMRRGVRYFAGDIRMLGDILANIFSQPKERIDKLTVVKNGGSCFDFNRQNRGSRNLRYVMDTLVQVKVSPPVPKYSPRQRIIVMVGAGQFGDEAKYNVDNFPDTKEVLPILMFKALDANIRMVHSHIPEAGKLLQSEDFYFLDDRRKDQQKSQLSKIIFMTIAPHYLLARDQIPLQDSDTHLIAVGEHYGASRAIIIKRTDGIYDFDPNVGGFTGDINRWREAQSRNRMHSVVTVDDLLSGRISREGTDERGNHDGSTGHLMEDSALRYFARCKNLEEIVVVHIAPEEMHFQLIDNVYQHIITGENVFVDPETGWRGVLEQNIRNAFKGIAKSRIVRN